MAAKKSRVRMPPAGYPLAGAGDRCARCYTKGPRKCRSPGRAKRRGSAVLELSLVLPILISLGLICVDFGRVAFYYIAVTNAAMAGAQYASANPYPPAAVSRALWVTNAKNAVTAEFAGSSGYSSSTITPTVSAPTVDPGNSSYYLVSVTATYSFNTLISWSWLPGYNNTISLSRTVVLREMIY